MFYEIEVKSHIRVPPKDFKLSTKKAVLQSIRERFSTFMSKDLGIVIGVSEILDIGDGILIPGDGAAYYKTRFKVITFKPELQEVIQGDITEIADFGTFINLGPIEGMIHISQTMDDFVSFNKSGTLAGKESKQVLRVGDKCRARIIALSYKEIDHPKIGLTMRQPSLGALTWIEDELKKQKEVVREVKKK